MHVRGVRAQVGGSPGWSCRIPRNFERSRVVTGPALIVAGAILVLWLATNLSDPAPSAKYLLPFGVLMIAAGLWAIVRRR